MRRVLWAVLWSILVCPQVGNWTTCRAEILPPVDEVLQRMVERAHSEAADPNISYLCTKETVTEQMDVQGRITERKVKVGESHSKPEGAKDANKWGSQNGINLNYDLLRRYNFTVVKRELLNGRWTLLLTFVPKDPPAPVRHIQDRLLNRAMGTLWVDEEDYQLVKASICLGEPVSFGILGAVDALSFAFERERATDGNWLTHWTETFVKARKLFKPIQTRKRVDCRDFRKLEETSDTSAEARSNQN